MDVYAYPWNASNLPYVELGSIADSIWVNGFKFSEERNIQVSRPMNAPYPNLFDRVTSVESFQFAAGRSFTSQANSGVTAAGSALQFLGSHPASVPRKADLQFKSQGAEIWLCYCAIMKVELVRKESALVVFGYTITGGSWLTKRTTIGI